MDDREWIHLVLRSQAGDREALDALFRGLQSPLHRHLVRLVGDVHLADDLLQETFVQIYRKLVWLREPAHVVAWARRIASRLAYRKAAGWRTVGSGGESGTLEGLAGPSAVEAAFPEEWTPRLVERLERVPATSRIVLVLHYQQGLSLAEVAEYLDIPAGTAKSRLAYGLNALRAAFAAEIHESRTE